MRNENYRATRWLRGLVLTGIAALGLVLIIGSGGGGLGFLGSICDTYPDSCGPLPPPPPSVTVEPPSATAQVGTPVSFVAQTANTSGLLAYTWRRSSDGGTSYVDIAGATGRSYALASVNLADDGAMFLVAVRQANGVVLQATSRLAVSVTPGIVFADSEFPADGWQAAPAIVAGNPAFTHLAERIDTGGNPGAFRRMTVQVAPGSALSRVLHLSRSSTYDPQVQGAITVIDHAEDCILFSTSATNSAESGIYIEQNGRRYVSDTPRIVCTSSQWTSAIRPGLRRQDFRQFDGPACNAGEACPDFSASASALRLGYERIVYSVPGGSVVHGIDNWRVTVWRR